MKKMAEKTQKLKCCCVRICFVLYNFIHFMIGLGVIALAIWTHHKHRSFFPISPWPTYPALMWILLNLGLLLVVTFCFGCIAERAENRFMVGIYGILIMSAFVLESAVALIAVTHQTHLGKDLRHSLPSKFAKEYSVDSLTTKSIDEIQSTHSCCGALIFTEWRETSLWYVTASKRNVVPDSCCKTQSPECGRRDHPSNIYYTGCVHRLEMELDVHLGLIWKVCSVCMGIQLIGLLYSLCFICKLGKAKKVRINSHRRPEQEMNNEITNGRTKKDGENGEYFPIYTFNGPTRV